VTAKLGIRKWKIERRKKKEERRKKKEERRKKKEERRKNCPRVGRLGTRRILIVERRI
jgi:hypothetical protein